MSTKLERDVRASLNIRPFEHTDEDYDTLTALSNAVWPDNPTTSDMWKHKDDTWDKKYFHQRVMIELEGRPVAYTVYCEPAWSYKPRKFSIHCNVHPDYQRRGIGTAVYDYLMAKLESRNPRTLISSVRENNTDSLRFMKQRGFEIVLRMPLSELNVQTFDFDQYASLDERMRSEGIKILSVAELEEKDSDWAHKLYELNYEILADVPSPDPFTKRPFEQFEKRFLKSPSFLPEANFLALDGEQYVGYSALWKHDTQDDKLNTGLTGVVRSHRRKAICSALKVRSFHFAKAYGAKVIETGNEENNPMYQLNLKLGFEPRPAWMDFEKVLDNKIEETLL
jgi:ribosomal protein S18 acetylase RimI-like enzyme